MTQNNPGDMDLLSHIHTAFQLGWNITELQNRILMNAFSSSMDSLTLQLLYPDSQTPKDPLAAYSQLSLSTTSAYNHLHSLMKEAVNSEIVEVIKNQQYEIPTIFSPKPGADHWMTSIWRTSFQRITTLHLSRFPVNDSTGTIYTVAEDDYKNYLLHPKDTTNQSTDYADIGIKQEAQFKEETFNLPEVTRRALNCLILLYTKPEDSLAPTDTMNNRERLMQNLLPVQANHTAAFTDDDYRAAMKVLSGVVVRFLQAWDDFLRERYYVDPTTNPSSTATNPEAELLAYEAGRSLSGLSWEVSKRHDPVRRVIGMLKPGTALAQPDLYNKLDEYARALFKHALVGREVDYIQSQLAGLSKTLDTLYYTTSGKTQPAPGDTTAPIDPELPSTTIDAITASLDYWQRTAQQLCPDTVHGQTAKKLPLPIMPQIHLHPAQIVPTPPSSVATTPLIDWSAILTWKSSYTLRLALISQSHIWQSLLLGEQSLSSFSGQKFTQSLLAEFMRKVEDAIFQSDRSTWLSPTVLAFIGSIVLGIVIVVILVVAGKNVQDVGAGALFLVGSVFGFLGGAVNRLIAAFSPASAQQPTTMKSSTTTTTKTGNGDSSTGTTTVSNNPALDKLAALVGIVSKELIEVFDNAYARVTIEFAHLNYAVSVADPLIQFFFESELATIHRLDGTTVDATIRGGYDFLTKVIWTGKDLEDEIERVVSAAFGPIGAFINGSTTNKGKGNTKK